MVKTTNANIPAVKSDFKILEVANLKSVLKEK